MLRLKDNIELNTTGYAATAGKATQDGSGNTITSTYIKALSVNGKTITYTRGDNTTGTITTQDTVYTLPKASATVLGGIKVGKGLGIGDDGTLYATGKDIVADNVEWTGILNRPTKVSYWENDSGYITLSNVMSGATASTAGKAGVVPAPASGYQNRYLRGDGQWVDIAGTVDSTYVKKAGDTMTGTLRIPKGSGVGIANSDGKFIIRDHNNQNVTIDATGGALYLGYENTGTLNLLNGKGTFNSSGTMTINGEYTTQAGVLNLTASSKIKYNTADKSIEFIFV